MTWVRVKLKFERPIGDADSMSLRAQVLNAHILALGAWTLWVLALAACRSLTDESLC